jgi:hypothetical protein
MDRGRPDRPAVLFPDGIEDIPRFLGFLFFVLQA